jgi:hypothetical protein
MGTYPGGDAVRLLRSINALQAHGRVGSIVFPSAAARSAGLKPGTERYEEALWGLARGCYELDQEWLRNAESGGPWGSGLTGESAFQCGFHPSS